MLYIEDNNQQFPTRHPGEDLRYNTTDDSYWDDKLFPYVKDYDIFLCPILASMYRDDVKMYKTDLRDIEKYKHAQAYIFNSWLKGWYPGAGTAGDWPDRHEPTPGIIPVPLKSTQVKSASSVVLISDKGGIGDSATNLSNAGLSRFSYFYNGGIRFMPDIMPAHEVNYKANGGVIPFHNIRECSGGVSLGFTDGHCEQVARFDYTLETVNNRTPPKPGLKINPSGAEWE
jgi:hypothetical protein